MTPKRMITLLSGGTGTPKLLLGIRKFVPDSDLTIIGNTGDDDTFYGLLVSPDVDTILYLFSGQLDLEKFWGVLDDSYILLQTLEKFHENAWFKLGDKDLALHLLRNKLLSQGLTLSEAITEICIRLKIKAKILPMSNDPVRTKMITAEDERLSFQEYTVKLKEKVAIKKVVYQGVTAAKTTNEVIDAIKHSQAIVLGPSNPITSIAPILAIKDIREALCQTEVPIIAISPLSKGKAFSGPAAQLLNELGIKSNTLGIAELYKDFLNTMIVCNTDKKLIPDIEALGIKVICTNISMATTSEREQLAKIVLDEINYK